MFRLIAKIFILAIFYFVSSASFSDPEQRTPKWCEREGFYCLKVRKGESWESLFPDEYDRGLVMRINHINSSIYRGSVITVPEQLDGRSLLDFSPFPLNIEPPNEKLLIFDPKKLAFAAYAPDGTLVRWGPAVGGKDYCPDIHQGCRTKSGTFRIYSLGSSNCVSSKFPVEKHGGAPMPYCMFFNGGQAFHGSPGGIVRKNASHGCVRLFVQDAEWMRYEFAEGPSEENDFRGTKVVVLPY